MIRPTLMLLCVTVLGGLAAGDDSVAIAEKLDKAKATYDAKVKAIREAVVKGLDAKEEQATKAGNKKLVDLVEAEREAFEKEGLYPSAVDAALKRQADEAYKGLVTAHETAVKEYTKAKMRPEAKSVEGELAKVQTAATEVRLKEAFGAGKSLAGQRRGGPFRVKVSERNGTTFKGEMILGDGRTYVISGQIKGDRLSFTSEKNPGSQFQQTYTGGLKENRFDFKFEGTGPTGGSQKGEGSLSPDKSR